MEVDATIRDSHGNEAPLDSDAGKAIIEGVVRDAVGGFWGPGVTGPTSPLSFQTSRKDLLAALTRTQHAQATDEDRPVLQSWWLSVEGDRLTVHTSDNYRLTRATVDVDSRSDGWFGIHRSEAKALLAFLASGPDSLTLDAGDGVWSIHHEEGRLTGRLAPGQPPDWSRVTAQEPGTALSVVTFALAGKFASDAAKAAIGASGVVLVDWESSDRPTVWHSDGYAEWVMPVRIGGTAAAEPAPEGDD